MFITLNTGKIREHYKYGNTIGEGAFGVVKEVFSKIGGGKRAMKIIKKSSANKKEIEKMMDEVNILKQLDHPNILKLYEFYQDENHYYLITEFCRGGEMFEKIKQDNNFSEKTAAFYMKELFSTLIYMHNQGLVHRDIKPENILLDNEQHDKASIKIIDFGTGVKLKKGGHLTEVIGTPFYMAPEVFSMKYGKPIDVWSAGIITYIMLCGYPPFGGENEQEIFEAIRFEKLEFHPSEWQHISKEAKDLIKKMLDKNPASRIDAIGAFNDPWIQKNVMSTKLDMKVMNNLSNFQSQNLIQKAILTFITSQMMNNDEKDQMVKTFQALDKNGDGTLSREELVQGFQAFNTTESQVETVNKIIASIDNNNSGQIDFSEFCVASANYTKILQEKKILEAFKLFDKDGNGSISKSELQKMLGGVNMIQITSMIKEVDIDGDGEINFTEFKELLSKVLNSNK